MTIETAPFSAELRKATWPEHERAADATYLRALTAGELSRRQYADMVAQHYYAYLVLEEAAAPMRSDPVAGPFVVSELTRVPALVADLHELLGPGWARQVTPNAATEKYCARLREVCFDWPGGFIAHHYTRYLGDLSGGQYLKGKIEEIYGPAAGTRFYDFSALGDLAAFKVGYRQLLDDAPWDAEQRRAIVAETKLAYELNTEVLIELGRDL